MICTSSNNNLIAASEYGLQPECHVYSMPSKQVIAQFMMQTTLRSSAMSFSRDGNYLLIIGGVPDFTISIYDIKAQAFIKTPQTKLPFKHSSLRGASFNPRSHEDFSVLSDSKIYFYSLKHAFMKGDPPAHEDADENWFELKESFRYEVVEFNANQVPTSDDQPVVFSSLKWDMWNRVHLCTNKTQLLQVSSRGTPNLEQALEVNAIPLTTLLTQKNIIVSTDDGLLTWYRVEQPIENTDGTIEDSFAISMLDQVDYEYDFYANKNNVTGESDDSNRYPAAYLKYSRSYNQVLLGTQNGLLGKVAVPAEKPEEEDD
jgi:WD40 repeat protein